MGSSRLYVSGLVGGSFCWEATWLLFCLFRARDVVQFWVGVSVGLCVEDQRVDLDGRDISCPVICNFPEDGDGPNARDTGKEHMCVV